MSQEERLSESSENIIQLDLVLFSFNSVSAVKLIIFIPEYKWTLDRLRLIQWRSADWHSIKQQFWRILQSFISDLWWEFNLSDRQALVWVWYHADWNINVCFVLNLNGELVHLSVWSGWWIWQRSAQLNNWINSSVWRANKSWAIDRFLHSTKDAETH